MMSDCMMLNRHTVLLILFNRHEGTFSLYLSSVMTISMRTKAS